MIKRILHAFSAIAAIAFLGFWLSLGIYQDPEFSKIYLFQKHKLTLKFYFSSPIGESDRRLEDLSPYQQRREKDFKEYVYVFGGYSRGILLFNF
nr:unknown [uncultured bacterium]